MSDLNENWFLDSEVFGTDSENEITEYDITSSPNDFNVKTLYDFMETGAIQIPSFQRNYVWDKKRASRLIESIIIGLPVPQIFLYEESRNKFLIIDGQQRMLTIYFFVKRRFPKSEMRAKVRQIFLEHGNTIPEKIIHDNQYFEDFNLDLPSLDKIHKNKLNSLNYSTLGDLKFTFDMRTIRNIIIKQNAPQEDDSSIHEIFNRLNSGGINLKPQEIRSSLYYSEFYKMIYKLNVNNSWRKIVGNAEADLHLKDVEIILRAFAILIEGEKYKSPMNKYLNMFSKNTKLISKETVEYLNNLFSSFLSACDDLGAKPFITQQNKFNISLFESVFYAIVKPAFNKKELVSEKIDAGKMSELRERRDFVEATLSRTTDTSSLETRLRIAKEVFAE